MSRVATSFAIRVVASYGRDPPSGAIRRPGGQLLAPYAFQGSSFGVTISFFSETYFGSPSLP